MTIFYYNSNETTLYDFLNENQTEINNITIDAIRKCLESDLDELKFMKIQPNDQIYTIKRSAFEKFLKNAKSYYENIEMYEKCSECVKLLRFLD